MGLIYLLLQSSVNPTLKVLISKAKSYVACKINRRNLTKRNSTRWTIHPPGMIPINASELMSQVCTVNKLRLSIICQSKRFEFCFKTMLHGLVVYCLPINHLNMHGWLIGHSLPAHGQQRAIISAGRRATRPMKRDWKSESHFRHNPNFRFQ